MDLKRNPFLNIKILILGLLRKYSNVFDLNTTMHYINKMREK